MRDTLYLITLLLGGWLLTSVIFGLVIARWMRLQKMQDPRAAP